MHNCLPIEPLQASLPDSGSAGALSRNPCSPVPWGAPSASAADRPSGMKVTSSEEPPRSSAPSVSQPCSAASTSSAASPALSPGALQSPRTDQ